MPGWRPPVIIPQDRGGCDRAIVDGENAWLSDTGVPVVTGGAPTSGVVVPLTYRPDLLLGEVTGSLTGVDGPLGDEASSVTIVSRPDTGAVLGFDARPQPGASDPIPFSVPFNVTDVDPAASYVVTGQVTDGDRSWESATGPAVITNGNPISGVGVPLVAVATPTPSPSPSPTPVPTATPSPEPDEGEGGPPWALLVVLAEVAGAVIAVVIARRGAQPPPAAGGDGPVTGPGPGPEATAGTEAAGGPAGEPAPGPDAATGPTPGS